jgi:glycosyltransferase involved in cell wall biosynthesis
MKFRVLRVVTASYVVPWHLNNTLNRISDDFDVCVVGQNVSLNQSNYPKIKFVDININRKTNLIADIKALLKLCIIIFKYRPHIVHSIMPKAGFLASLAGVICRVPVRLHTFTGQTWVAKNGFARYIYYFFDVIVNKLNTECLTDSFSQSFFLAQNHITNSGRPLHVLSKGSLSGVEINRFNFDLLCDNRFKLRESLGINTYEFVFSFIARKTQAKGALDMLNAFSLISTSYPKTRLLFIGPDEDGKIKQLKLSNPQLFNNVIEIGHVNNHEEYLAITDVLCLPSYREGFGSIIIDAAAMSVPAIGSRIPGLTDSIVEDVTGLLFKEGNIDELSKKMILFIENPELQIELGKNAKNRVDEFFSADNLYCSLKEFYNNCLSKNINI